MSDKSELEAIRTVKRYTQPCVQQQLGPEFKVAEVPLFESAKGKYVLFTDYDALLAERDAARAELKEAVAAMKEIKSYGDTDWSAKKMYHCASAFLDRVGKQP